MPELKPGWLDRQMKEVRDDVATWPEWMRRAGGFMDENKSAMTPEQREAALKLAIIVCVAGDGFHTKIENAKELARALLDLHAEVVRLREALEKIQRGAVDHSGYWSFSIARAALSGSPATED
jgi:hypothetical protein